MVLLLIGCQPPHRPPPPSVSSKGLDAATVDVIFKASGSDGLLPPPKIYPLFPLEDLPPFPPLRSVPSFPGEGSKILQEKGGKYFSRGKEENILGGERGETILVGKKRSRGGGGVSCFVLYLRHNDPLMKHSFVCFGSRPRI